MEEEIEKERIERENAQKEMLKNQSHEKEDGYKFEEEVD